MININLIFWSDRESRKKWFWARYIEHELR